WSAATNNYEFRLRLDRSFPVQELLWWTRPLNVAAGVPLHDPHPQVVMLADASLSGWGAHVGDLVASGVWSVRQQGEHINVLELQAIRQGLLAFLPLLANKVVQVRADNTTALAYLKKGGGTQFNFGDFRVLRDPSHDFAAASYSRSPKRSGRCSVSTGSSPVDGVDVRSR